MDESCVYDKLQKMQDAGFMALNKPYLSHAYNIDRFYKKYPEKLELKVIRCYNDIIIYLLNFDA